ncbi:hypothetical protein FB45DRAFT_353093 [Roridomyces roridus]|uniref:F-box domain-containing protein n=1 Tax=Roridomyces roridus TaxID=1738132 RepID=A0AAD7FSL5_9AGAR|nr:hypothetical protein FB45DRAFT_353093 [Roridomyces roridus]
MEPRAFESCMSHPHSKATREADRARVVAIDAEIHQLEQRLHALQTEQESCQSRLDVYKYPVLTLPNEITSEIFIHFLPPYPLCTPMTGLNSPTSLTHICGKWREIALATPKLWRAISACYTYSEGERLARVAQTWLERSGSCPLSFQMGACHPQYWPEFLLHRQRWQHVQLELASEDVVLIKGPMPLLETLSLVVDDYDYTHPATSSRDFPLLRAVTLDVAHHGNWLPVSQLTSLTFEQVEPANYYLPLLQDAVNLVRLHLIDCDTDVPPQRILKFDRLETLVLVSSYLLGSASQIFETFTFPALHTLHVSGEFLGGDPASSIAPLLIRSRCNYKKFSSQGNVVFRRSLFVRPSPPSRTLRLRENILGTREGTSGTHCD